MARNGRHFPVARALITVLAIAGGLASCGGGSDMSLDTPPGSSAPRPPASSSAPIAKEVLADEQAGTPVDPRIVAADNTLGVSLLDALDQNVTGNVAISPTSIALAFEMLYNGAAGSTQQGMSQALDLGSFTSAQDVDTANASIQAALMNADPNVTITIANSLWMHLTADPVLPSFTDVNQNYYAAEIGDLAGAPANVNAWVAQATRGLITQLLPSGDYDSTILVLANAIYFKGAWTSAFDPSATTAQPFTLADGTQVSCQMMQRQGVFDYYQGANFQMVRLPYGKRHLSMIIVLPASGVSLASLLAGMTPAELGGWIAQLASLSTVNLGLPKFKATYATEPAPGQSLLPSALTALGMGAAFDRSQADFSGVAPNLFVSDAVHQTVVEVDETGTTAAAGSGVVAITDVGRSATAVMNRPFFYAIRDDDNGALLFLGLLMNPSSS
ncbi:MAG: serpin family protein [Steroidobacteraceae bacterium]